MDNNFFQVQEFYLQEKDYIKMETYHVIGLAQIFLPKDEISPPSGYGKERKRTPFTSRFRGKSSSKGVNSTYSPVLCSNTCSQQEGSHTQAQRHNYTKERGRFKEY